MTIQLFDDQLDLRERVRASMRKNKCVLIHATTGFGKTVLAADMIARARQNNRTAAFVVPRRQLLWQTAEKFQQFGIDFGYITSGKKPREAPVQMATLGSIVTRLDAVTPDVVFIDEGHFSFEQTLTVAKHYLALGAWVVYLTATPKPGMDAVVQDVISGESVAWMIKNKRLSSYRAYSPESPDLSMIKRQGDEYHQGQLASKMEHDNKVLVGNMVKHWRELALNRMTIAYGTSINHADMMAHEFRENGIPSASISSKTPDDELLRIIKGFARREIKILTNCDMATFGFDLSSASGMDVNIEAMIDAAPTLSIIKQTQKNGRALRYKEEPSVFLDHAGNIIHRDGTRNHGMPCDDRSWSIVAGAKAGVAGRASPIKQCPTCYANHRPAPQCTQCGHVYMIDGRVIRTAEGRLVEVHKTEVPVVKEFTPQQETVIKAMMKTAIDRGVHPAHARNWAKKKIREGAKL